MEHFTLRYNCKLPLDREKIREHEKKKEFDYLEIKREMETYRNLPKEVKELCKTVQELQKQMGESTIK